jgi:hypothetical protein
MVVMMAPAAMPITCFLPHPLAGRSAVAAYIALAVFRSVNRRIDQTGWWDRAFAAVGQLQTNKSVGGLFPNDGDGNAWGDKQVGFPPGLRQPQRVVAHRLQDLGI